MVDKSNARVRRMFSRIATRYDLLNHLLSLNVDRYWRWRTVRRVPPTAGPPVLDVCTGTGDLALAYLKAARGRAAVVGTDFCHEMLVMGEGKRQRLGHGRGIGFVEADTMSLPFPDSFFQLVSVAFGLRNVAGTEQGLAEMTRVCVPGGKVVVLEFSAPKLPLLRDLYGWYFHRLLPWIGQRVSGSREGAYRYLPESVAAFPSGEALAAKMRAAGLSEAMFQPLTFGIATMYIGTK